MWHQPREYHQRREANDVHPRGTSLPSVFRGGDAQGDETRRRADESLSNMKSGAAHARHRLCNLDVFDAGSGRAFADSLFESRHGFRFAFCFDLYAAIWRIAYPSADSLIGGRCLREIPKSHALHSAADHIMSVDAHRFQSPLTLTNCRKTFFTCCLDEYLLVLDHVVDVDPARVAASKSAVVNRLMLSTWLSLIERSFRSNVSQSPISSS
jgi:hypothetical protein